MSTVRTQEEALSRAFAYLNEHSEASYCSVAHQFSLNKTTLINHYEKQTRASHDAHQSQQKFTPEEEDKIVRWVTELDDMGMPPRGHLSSESVETHTLIRQLASPAHTSAAEASVSAELLRQEKGKKPASKTDPRIITKGKVIGIKDLHRLRKKRLLDEAKVRDKRKRQLGTELKNSSTKRRAAIVQELKCWGGEVTLVIGSESIAVEKMDGTLNPEQDSVEQTFHRHPLAQITLNQAGDPGPTTASKMIDKITIENVLVEASHCHLQVQLEELQPKKMKWKVAIDPNTPFTNVETIKKAMDEIVNAQAAVKKNNLVVVVEGQQASHSLGEVEIESYLFEWQL
ncbi:hypothetical protein HOY80DRAFT_1136797 [Tuber brumale]|nr:hypothetical protein HOY80DRAFT_1136797 [Tuber brumale]